MAKQKTTSRSSVALRWALLTLVLLVIVIAPAIWGFVRVRAYVEKNLACPAKPPTVVFKDGTRPAWMDDTLVQRIVRSVQPATTSSAFDSKLLATIGQTLKTNAWVKNVRQVRRVFRQSAGDTIEIDCEYRAPIALVVHRNLYILVDAEGVRLPEQFPITALPPIMFSTDGHVNLRIIEGVTATAPLPGRKWDGADLQAGLELARFLYKRNCAEEIHRINVCNFAGRQRNHDSQIVLLTIHGTRLNWNGPVNQRFHSDVSANTKLHVMARNVDHYGRVDAGKSAINLYLDRPTAVDEAPVVQVEPTRRGR